MITKFLLLQEFFVVRLQPPAGMDGSPLPGTSDPDQLIQCDLMDGRDAFLTVAQERHWEFSSLRRARYSTMAMLYELHSQIRVCFATYNCSHCHRQVEKKSPVMCLLCEGPRTRVGQPKMKYWKLHELHINEVKNVHPIRAYAQC